MANMTQSKTRKCYRVYLKDQHVGIPVWAYEFIITGDFLTFRDEANDYVCIIDMDRVKRVIDSNTTTLDPPTVIWTPAEVTATC